MKFIGLVGTNSKRSTNRQLLQYIQKHFADNAYYSRRASSPFFICNPLIESITENEIVFNIGRMK